MLDEAQAARRRELHSRAYAAGGALNRDEAEELRSLEALARAEAPAPGPSPRENPGPQQDRSSQQNPSRQPSPSPQPSPSRQPSPSTDPNGPERPLEHDDDGALATHEDFEQAEPGPGDRADRDRRRPRAVPLILTALVALLLGLGGGWLISQRADMAPAMSAEQAKMIAGLEQTRRFDPDSIRFAGEKYGAALWRATSNDGDLQCLIIATTKRTEHNCMRPPADDTPFAEPVNVSVVGVEGEQEWIYWASVTEDVSGREVVVIQRNAMGGGEDWTAQFTPDELIFAEKLVERGVDPHALYIVGYDDRTPVFITQLDDSCIYVVDHDTLDVFQACDSGGAPEVSLRRSETTYTVQQSSSRGPVLTITRGASADG